MKANLIKFGVLMIVSMFVLAACAGAGSDDEIRIGMIAPLTGGASVFGIAASQGAELAFDQVNEAGGLLDLPVNFLIRDDMHQPAESLTVYDRLVNQDNVIAIVGPVTSGPANAVAAAAAANRTPMISPTATHADVTRHGDFMFRACFLDAYQAYTMAVFARQNLGATTAAIIFDQGMAYSEGLATNFRAYFESMGGTIVANEAYMSGEVDFRTQLTSIRATNPEVLFVPDYFTVVALIAAQVRELEIDATLLGADGWEGVLGMVDDPSILDGAFFSAHFAADDPNPLVQSFVQSYTERFGVAPNSFAALGYDAARILAQAIQAAGSTDNNAIINAMQNINFNGVTGNITFDEFGDPIKDIVVIALESIGNEGSARLYHRFAAR